MLCEECQKNEATVVITVTAGSEVNTRHLCADCMKKMELRFAQGDVQGFLTSLLSILSNEPKAPALTCSGCGLTYQEFQRTGKLGCAQCYKDFAEQLRPLLQRIHGRAQHAGRVPEDHRKERDLAQSIEALRQQMEQAVGQEDFEAAARLRDEIRALSQQQEAANAQ